MAQAVDLRLDGAMIRSTITCFPSHLDLFIEESTWGGNRGGPCYLSGQPKLNAGNSLEMGGDHGGSI